MSDAKRVMRGQLRILTRLFVAYEYTNIQASPQQEDSLINGSVSGTE
jgi:hypothetical protein